MTQTRDPGDLPSVDPAAPGIPGGQRLEAGDIPPEYWRAFTLVAFAMNRFIVDHVFRSARLFENDTESLMLFGMLSHLNVAHLVPPGSHPATTLDANGRLPDPQTRLRPVRVRDLAQITGRPRETIRRKLERMEAAGRVKRVVNGWVLDVAAVDPQMQALTMDGVRRLMKTAETITAVLDDTRQTIRAEQSGPNNSSMACGPG